MYAYRMDLTKKITYQQACSRLVFGLLIIWFSVSFGCGIFLREWLDAHAPPVGHAPFGFWMAQQGAIICFIFLLVVYAVAMGLIDRRYGYSKEDN